MQKKYTTNSADQTKKLGVKLAKEILIFLPQKNAVVLCLSGNLGGGKTTFLQGFAKGLGIKEKILSPTFVIMKRFLIPQRQKKQSLLQKVRSHNLRQGYLFHIDCYRLKNHKDILSALGGPASGWEQIISDPKNIIAIEWPEKITKVLPKNIIKIKFKFIDKNKREIDFKM